MGTISKINSAGVSSAKKLKKSFKDILNRKRSYDDLVIFVRTFLDDLPISEKFIMNVLAGLGKNSLTQKITDQVESFHDNQFETEVAELKQSLKDKEEYHDDQIKLLQSTRTKLESDLEKEPATKEEVAEGVKKSWTLGSKIIFGLLVLIPLFIIIADVINIQSIIFDNTSRFESPLMTYVIATAGIVGLAFLIGYFGYQLKGEKQAEYFKALTLVGIICLILFFFLITRHGFMGESANLSVNFDTISNASENIFEGSAPSIWDWILSFVQVIGGAAGVAGFFELGKAHYTSHGKQTTRSENQNHKKLVVDISDFNTRISHHKKAKGEYQALLVLIESTKPNYIARATVYLRKQYRLYSFEL